MSFVGMDLHNWCKYSYAKTKMDMKRQSTTWEIRISGKIWKVITFITFMIRDMQVKNTKKYHFPTYDSDF